MNTSLLSRIFSDNPSDAALLDAWLAERDADLAMRALDDEPLPFTVDAERLGQAAAPHDTEVQPGQIRVLSPKFVADNNAFPYIAVLDHWMEDIWLVAPFSPYSYPASEGEMTTGIRLVGQRVLQCWNARTAHEEIIGQSYIIGVLDELVLRDALALFRHSMSGRELPADFTALVGFPILSKADPRCEYLAESAERYKPLTEAAIKLEARLALEERIAAKKDLLLKSSAFVRTTFRAARPRALAAGDKEKESSETFLAPAFGVEIVVKYAPSEGKVRLVVYDSGGERDGKTLEGFSVVGKDGSLVGVINDGVLVAQAFALEEGFLLIHPDTLEPVELNLKGL